MKTIIYPSLFRILYLKGKRILKNHYEADFMGVSSLAFALLAVVGFAILLKVNI